MFPYIISAYVSILLTQMDFSVITLIMFIWTSLVVKKFANRNLLQDEVRLYYETISCLICQLILTYFNVDIILRTNDYGYTLYQSLIAAFLSMSFIFEILLLMGLVFKLIKKTM